MQIDRVTPNLSYGHIVEDGVQMSTPFTPGSMELRDQVVMTGPQKQAAPAATSHVARHAMTRTKTSAATPQKSDSDW